MTQNPPTAPSSRHRELIRWALALLLALPATIPYFLHFHYAHAHGLIPTGFLIGDMPYYMANARAHFAGGHFHLFYQLPFSPYDNSPAIYFQPHTLLLGLLWKSSGLEVNTVFLIFSAIAVLVCARVAIALYEQIVGFGSRGAKLGLVLFFWGSGVVVLLSGAWLWLVGPGTEPVTFERLFDFDPFRGLWFLDFGRNLILGTEAYYHALFFGSILLVIRRRFIGSAALAFLLSISHPFSGIELLAVLGAWVGLERFILRKRTVPGVYILAIAAITVFHLGYYLWFLPHASPEHRSLEAEWHQAFVLTLGRLLASIALVFPLALYTVYTRARWKAYFAQPWARLLAMWFVVALALANHDLLIKPIQPLHFTRGYIWTPLFFIGAPTLVALIDHLLKKRTVGYLAVAAVVCVFLLDNAMWLTTLEKRPDVITDGIMLTPDRQQVLDLLKQPAFNDSLVISLDLGPYANPVLGYLVTAYTPLRSWYSHPFNTPFKAQRIAQMQDLFQNGNYLDEWRRRRVIIILSKEPKYFPQPPAWADKIGAKLILENDSFRVYEVPPLAA